MRWHGQTSDLPGAYLRGVLAASPDHLAVVAEVDDQIVGLASAVRAPSGVREVAILVEDACQRRGLGTRLLDRLVGASVALGATAIEADVLVDHPQPISLLARYGPVRRRVSFGVVTVRVALTRR